MMVFMNKSSHMSAFIGVKQRKTENNSAQIRSNTFIIIMLMISASVYIFVCSFPFLSCLFIFFLFVHFFWSIHIVSFYMYASFRYYSFYSSLDMRAKKREKNTCDLSASASNVVCCLCNRFHHFLFTRFNSYLEISIAFK